jgi:hypothetical protein
VSTFVSYISHFNVHCSCFKTGEIAEYDTPGKLVEDSSSRFAKLVSEYRKCKKTALINTVQMLFHRNVLCTGVWGTSYTSYWGLGMSSCE